ncbi:MAG: hypothetical protein A3H32_18045 [Betaproteobacteria bacterium RIFCSPLOWO2_02_FULL_63_19]|nr:MAG: hypothetical protein A3H32_18045 [Betaproteobacteria bacterium RIFCSPLOWO2_02_FULL_63_19]
MKKILARVATVALALFFVAQASAQYPERAIRIMVPIPPGGAPDLVARLIGQELSKVFHKPVVVENRPGSNGVIASEITARATPDGYTLLLGPEGLVVINPHLYAKLRYDPLKDLIPVASVFLSNFVMAVNSSLPVKNFQEFIEYARKADRPLPYGSGGNGSQHQLIMELLKSRAGIKLMHVPYKGGRPATTALVAGQVAAMFSGASIVGQIRSGKLRAIALSGEKRSSAFPGVPTISEFYPGASINPWAGIYAPAGTPAAIVATLRTEVNRILARPEIAENFDRMGGVEPYVTSPEELAALIRTQYASYGKIVKDIGVTLD